MKAPEEGQGLLQHINFWQQDELRLEHPEVQVGACQRVSRRCMPGLVIIVAAAHRLLAAGGCWALQPPMTLFS